MGQEGSVIWNGASWELQNNGLRNSFDLMLISETDGWSVGRFGFIQRFNGLNWEDVPSPTGEHLDGLFVDDNGAIWAYGPRVLLVWSGSKWEVANSEPPLFEDYWEVYFDLDMVSSNEGWAVGGDRSGDKYPLISYFDGSRWIKAHGLGARGEYAATLWNIDMLNSTYGWAVGEFETILRFYDKQWRILDIPNDYVHTNDVVVFDENDVWIAGQSDSGDLWHWDGSKFTTSSLAPGYELQSISKFNNVAWAVGDQGRITYWDGSVWKEFESPSEDDLFEVDVISNQEFWVISKAREIFRWKNSTWEQIEYPPTRGLIDIEIQTSDQGWLLAYSTESEYDVILLAWDGVEWKYVDTPQIFPIYLIADVPNEDQVWGIGRGQYFRWIQLDFHSYLPILSR